MNEKRIPSPQHAPAVALMELITEHPELQALRWSLCPDGLLTGTAMYLDVDVRPLMAAYVDALGARPASDVVTRSEGSEPRFTSWLYVVWRDVPLSITLGCAASLVAPGVTASSVAKSVLGREVAA